MIVLVTGATAGFGRVIATRFVEGGHRVVAIGRRSERLQALADDLGRAAVHPVVLDVRDRDAVADALAKLPAGFQAIDVLVNNAGLAMGLQPAQRADLSDWETMVDTNVKGVLYLRPEPASEFASRFQQLRRATVLPGVGHNAPQEASKPFAEAVLEVGRPG